MHNKQFCLLHQFLNKAVSLLIVFIIVITLSGCSLPWNQKQISETTISATEDNADFTEYVNNLFADLLSFRYRLIGLWGIRRYYQKRKGETLLSPTEQQQVIAIARNLGLQRAEYFDAYVEEYDFT